MHITRRDFVGSAALGLGATALAGSATTAMADAPAEGAVAAASVQPIYVTSDVLIIGAGAAGTEAAVNAAASGASVVIVDKKQFGHCGDSGLHYSGRMTTSAYGVEGDSPEVHLEDASAVGTYIIDQDLGAQVLQAYYDDAITLKDENYGNVHFREWSSGKPYIERSVNRPRLWCGFKLNPVAYKAIELGVNIYDYTTVTKLLAGEDGSVAGATAISFKTGAFYVFRAKSVILATGGDAGLWGAGTVASKFGGGVELLTGDGHALAAPFGVEFRDLEFRALYSNFGVLSPSGISNLACLYSSQHAEWEDAEGNKILADEAEAGTLSLRTNVAEWYRARENGRATPAGGVYAPIDSYMVGLGDGTIPSIGHPADLWDQLKISYLKQGEDLTHAEVGPHLTYDYGGIVTDIHGSTGVDGLFACGEVAMHCGSGYGSFRMFSSSYALGKRSGLAAAERAASVELAGVDSQAIADEAARVYGLLSASPVSPVRVHEMKHRIQEAAWKGSGAMRSERLCNEALAELDAAEAELGNVCLVDKSLICNTEWFEALALANMICMARMDTLASMTRTESRGSHLRAEYPEQDNDNWCKNVYIRYENGGFAVDVRDSVKSHFQPPEGKFDLGGGVVEELM